MCLNKLQEIRFIDFYAYSSRVQTESRSVKNKFC